VKVGIVGSRGFDDYPTMERILLETINPMEDSIVSGGAKGADTLAKRFADENEIYIKEFPAEWNVHGKYAGLYRNDDIVAQSDYIIAFWDGKSKGTKDTIDKARDKGIVVMVFQQES
jgi:ABC-type sugar transport system substrate-binding protein